MTDATSGATAPPKKRFGFKKAAWQTAPTEGQQEQDIFSHSSEFQSIVAEESKRRLEEKKLLQEVRRQKLQEERNPKRRRVPATLNEDPFGTGLGSPTAKEKDTRSKRHVFSLDIRYYGLIWNYKQQDPDITYWQHIATGHDKQPTPCAHKAGQQLVCIF